MPFLSNPSAFHTVQHFSPVSESSDLEISSDQLYTFRQRLTEQRQRTPLIQVSSDSTKFVTAYFERFNLTTISVVSPIPSNVQAFLSGESYTVCTYPHWKSLNSDTFIPFSNLYSQLKPSSLFRNKSCPSGLYRIVSISYNFVTLQSVDSLNAYQQLTSRDLFDSFEMADSLSNPLTWHPAGIRAR